MGSFPEISIVVPLFNESQNIELLYNELITNLNPLKKSFEIIFVDDGSRDASFELVKKICLHDPAVRGFSLSRNFGHQAALVAGLEKAKGAMVIMMDADLQHPPKLIPELINLYQQGYDIVNTKRKDTIGSSWCKKFTSRWFYRILNFLTDFPIEAGSADFRLMSKDALQAFLQLNERNRFTRGLVSWMGFRQTYIDYIAPKRKAGISKYTLKKMLNLGMNGITAFSSKPLRMAFYLGVIIFITGIIYSLYALIEYFSGKTIQGWTSILLSVLIIGGFQLLSLGIIGEYIAKIFNEVKYRPLYFIKDSTEPKNP